MPNLKQVIEMFEEFGFSEKEVRQGLGSGKSAHNAFEGLKVLLTIRWAEMSLELGFDRLKELEPKFETLINLKITSRRTKKDMKAKEENEVKNLTEKLLDCMTEQKEGNLKAFMGVMNERFQKMDKQGLLPDAAKERLRALGMDDVWKDS